MDLPKLANKRKIAIRAKMERKWRNVWGREKEMWCDSLFVFSPLTNLHLLLFQPLFCTFHSIQVVFVATVFRSCLHKNTHPIRSGGTAFCDRISYPSSSGSVSRLEKWETKRMKQDLMKKNPESRSKHWEWWWWSCGRVAKSKVKEQRVNDSKG